MKLYSDYQEIMNYINAHQYIEAIFILIIFFALSKIFLFVSKKVIKRLTKKTTIDIDDKLIEGLEKPISYILLLLGLRISLTTIALSSLLRINLNHIINTIIIIIATYMAALIINLLIEFWGKEFAKKTKSDLDDELLPIAYKFVKVIIYIIGFILVLHEWEINVAPLLASLGIVGIAIGFAVKDYLSNIIGGIALILDKNFKVGDMIVAEGETGTIQEIGLRTTRIKTFDDEIITIPNGILSNTKIQNFMQPDLKVRVAVPFSVAYGIKHEKIKELALKVLMNIEHLKEPEPSVSFIEMGNFSLNFKLYFWVDHPNKRSTAKEKANCLLYDTLNKAKIEIPYPTQVIKLKK